MLGGLTDFPSAVNRRPKLVLRPKCAESRLKFSSATPTACWWRNAPQKGPKALLSLANNSPRPDHQPHFFEVGLHDGGLAGPHSEIAVLSLGETMDSQRQKRLDFVLPGEHFQMTAEDGNIVTSCCVTTPWAVSMSQGVSRLCRYQAMSLPTWSSVHTECCESASPRSARFSHTRQLLLSLTLARVSLLWGGRRYSTCSQRPCTGLRRGKTVQR